MLVIPRLAEKGFVILSLLFLTDPVVLFQAWELNPVKKVFSLVIHLGIILLIVAWRKKIVCIFIKEKFLWALIGIALLSVLWSVAPGVSLRQSLVLVRSTLFGVYLAARFSVKEQVRLLAWMLGIAMLLSLVFALVLPNYGVMGMGDIHNPQDSNHQGAWRGIYIHKNPLGRLMVMSALVFLLSAISSHRYRWVAWTGFGLSVCLILLSTSKTSLVVLLTLMSLLPFYRALRWKYTLAVPFFITVILVGGGVAILSVSNAEAILGAFGRDLTLTGRTDLWATVLDKIWERPWLGYGYAGFWQGWRGESADIWSVLNWQPPHSHNGLLDLWLDLGLLGVTAFLLSFIMVCFQAVTWVRLTKTTEELWPLVYLTFLLLVNITETSLLTNNSLWLLYVAVSLSTHNRSNNMAQSNAFLQQKVYRGAMKQTTQTRGGSGA